MNDRPMFPFTYTKYSHRRVPGSDGISIRQWYAGLAMQGMFASNYVADLTLAEIAHDALRVADAMIAEMEKCDANSHAERGPENPDR